MVLNELIHLIRTADLPSSLAAGPTMERPGKRKRGEGGEDSDEESQSGIPPPMNDIYRARQQKRANTTNISQNSS